jgi:pimeloyl-ACP methyl ester carboxylesterase
VIPRLDLAAHAVDFSRRPHARMADYAKAVVDQSSRWDRVIVVAHSLGGAIGLSAVAGLGDRLAGFAAVSAVLPSAGQSFTSCLPFPERLVVPLILRVVGTKPPEKAIHHSYCQDLDPATAAEVIERFSAESRQVYTDKVRSALPAQVPSRYLVLADDAQFSQAQQRGFAESASIPDIAEVRGGHLAMLSNPEGVAQALNKLAARVG